MKRILYTFLPLFFLLVKTGSAQVVINEFSASNWKLLVDNYGKTDDWLELYNPSASDADLGGWFLSDKASNTKKWAFPAGTTLPAGGHLTVFCSKRDESVGGFHHTNFSLTQTKGSDYVILANPAGAIADSFRVQKLQVHQSMARTTDGSADWKICAQPTPGASNDGTPQFDGFAERPVMDLAAGFYTGTQIITITAADPTDVVYYTTDGTEPDEQSDKYTDPFAISTTTVVKAKAFSQNPALLPSFLQFNTYFIDQDFTLAVVSVAAEDLLGLANGNKDFKPVGTLEYFDQNKVRKARSYGEMNSHGQDSWVNNQRSLDWVSRDEMGYSGAINEKLFGYSDRDEYQRVILRASGDDNYPGNFLPQHKGCAHIRDEYTQTLAKLGGLKLDVRAAERIVVFLNGQYWGVYGLREYPDDSDYTEYYYGQEKYDIQVLATWGNTWAEYGGDQAFEDWGKVRKFALGNDMADPANYQKIDDQVNLTSMIDYFICGTNFVASDWINYNTSWWRGTNPNGDHKKWGYMLWDFDAVFDYYINYSGVPNTDPDAQPCDIQSISNFCQNQFWNGVMNDTCFWQTWGGDSTYVCERVDGKHDLIFLKLQEENPVFRQLYYSRQADLQNTVFTCENMLYVLDSMVAVIDPEMTKHTQRWGGTKTKWLQNVKLMRDWIAERCTLFGQGMTDCYSLTGPFPLTLDVSPAGAGDIDFNTIEVKNFPWTGNYYGGMAQKLDADAEAGYQFSHWEVKKAGSIISASPTDEEAWLEFGEADTLTAVFTPVSAVGEAANPLGLRAYPTLSRDGNCTIEFDLKSSSPVSVRLVSAIGQEVAAVRDIDGISGKNKVALDFSKNNLPPGGYFLETSTGGLRSVVRLSVVD